MKRLEILVNSCDAYEDVWLPFFHALRFYWNSEVPPIILNTEKKSFNLEGLNIRRPSESIVDFKRHDDWGGRLLNALDCVNTEYVFMVFDDHIVESPIDLGEISRCIEILDIKPEICAFYMINPFLTLESNDSEDRFSEVTPGSDYILNSAPGVWRRDDLVRFVRKGDNPWAWEFFGSARVHTSGKKVFAPKEGSTPVYSLQHSLGGAIYRGKWVARVIEPALEKYGLSIDLSLRGIIEPSPISHSFAWKAKFFLTGFKMVGLSAIRLTARSMIRKIAKRLAK